MGGAWCWWFSRVAVGVVVGGAHCEGEAGAVASGSVVALCGEEGQLGFVSVDHDEDGVFSPPVLDVVFVARVFDAGVHDAGASAASNERAGDVVPAVRAAAASFVGFHGEGGAVVEGEGGGECVAVTVHVGEGDVGDVAASENFCVFFCRAVLVEGGVVVQAVGGVHRLYCSTTPRVCLHVWTRGLGCFAGGVRLVGCSPRGSVFVCLWARGVWVSCGRMWGLGGGVLGALWARDRVGAPLVGVWVVSRVRFGCLCEVCGWVWDVECVAFLEELFGLVCCDDAPDDGRPLSRVFAADGDGE